MSISPKQKIINMVDDMYNSFVGLPNQHPIVRNGIKEDAFTLVILDLLYKNQLNINLSPDNIDIISKIIVAPPDSGIDLFIEIEDNNEYSYHVIQSKFSCLSNQEISNCFSSMKRTVKDYLKNPLKVASSTLRTLISQTNFSKATSLNGKNCHYIVVHKGDLNYTSNQANNEEIVTLNDLVNVFVSLTNSVEDPKVPYDEFKSDSFNNFVEYSQSQTSERALLCNLRGYDLAILCNKYISSSIGRNILFGENLRESLDSKSRTYEDMCYTIRKEPYRFWHYNNGITILAESVDIDKDDSEEIDTIKLKNFSIINGAQTTSALGKFYREANMCEDEDSINNLKKVFVLARIMEVTNHELRDKICIYNNSQNPISSRDMVSTRLEQKQLQKNYMEGDKPNIYIEIRSGSKIPSHPAFEKHQRTTNEELAQLAFAAFFYQPFSAKDKKKSLFNKGNSEEYAINADYYKIFNFPDKDNSDEELGILFKKSRFNIDEVLFVKLLYNEAKKYLKRYYRSQQQAVIDKINTQPENAQQLQNRIDLLERNSSICSTCLFYCITYYFEIRDQFVTLNENRVFDYNNYYRNKQSEYKVSIIKDFADFYLQDTIEIISRLVGNSGSVSNWIRSSKSQTDFLAAINEKISIDTRLEEKCCNFVEKYMT